ncbi:MAG: glycosyl hydrolase [Cytophagales bacterium]|nr:MAG: glycosyl hydrolase [Cytophagales bacterium]
MPKKTILLLTYIPLLFFLHATFLPAYQIEYYTQEKKERESHWVDSIYASMTEQERIGQLFMVAAYSNRDESHYMQIDQLIKEHHIGGLIFFQGGPGRQAVLTNRYQAQAKIPLLIGIDGEWGLGMRLDSTISFPRQMALGAIQDDTLIYQMGAEVAYQAKRIGIHINFAPVVDVNSNPYNPVIGSRSFGENKEKVSKKGIAYMRGMQDNGIIANAKHFPGHGDTDADSHHTLPSLNHTRERLNEIELYPFKALMEAGLQSVMVAHLSVPAFESYKFKPTTLSYNVVTTLLKEEMHFEGLVFTDALNMKGVANYYKAGELDVLALLAGNDILLFPENVPLAISMIEKNIKEGKIKMEDLEVKVKKILHYKYRAGLYKKQIIELKNLYEDLNNANAKKLQETLFREAITVPKNLQELVPFRRPDTVQFASLEIGKGIKTDFRNHLDNYASFQHYFIAQDAIPYQYDTLLKSLQKYEVVVVGIQDMLWQSQSEYGINALMRNLIEKLSQKTKVVLTVFGMPYSLRNFPNAQVLICANEENTITRALIPQLLFGVIGAEGKLPVTVGSLFSEGDGKLTASLQRLGIADASTVGFDVNKLQAVDELIEQSIQNKVMPGCQLLVARKGSIVWNKSYGYQDYEKSMAVTQNTLYDAASITKVCATLLAIQYLYDQNKIKLEKNVAEYLPELANTDKADITIEELLLHQSGLQPFIPYWQKTIHPSKTLMTEYYSAVKSAEYPYQVANNIFAKKDMEETIWRWTVDSRREVKSVGKERYKYVYSDLNFYFLKRIAERILQQPIEVFLAQKFYQPLGLSYIGFNPLERFQATQISPTEMDTYFRQQLIRGVVHDQGAAMLGGVGGHAGLFSNANDLAVIMQMILQKGYYGGQRFLQASTIELFNQKRVSENRRGLGWDKPDQISTAYMITQLQAPNAIAHSGFTGCLVWADPDKDLVVVFLSNRIHPSVDNQQLIQQKTRTRILEIIYQSIQK